MAPPTTLNRRFAAAERYRAVRGQTDDTGLFRVVATRRCAASNRCFTETQPRNAPQARRIGHVTALLSERAGYCTSRYLIRQSGQIQFSHQDCIAGIQGVSSNYPPMTNWQIAAGRAITQEDERSAALVAVSARQWAGNCSAPFRFRSAQRCKARGVSLRVVGKGLRAGRVCSVN